jgi:glycine/D-amino acid oxidase-like deaminating enzyme
MSAAVGNPDVIVIGAGIVGAACARALAREGLRVLVLEADFPGGGSTGVAMGHIVVLDDSDAQLQMTARSRDLWDDLAAEMPADCEVERRGTLWIATNDVEMEAARAKGDLYLSWGVNARLLDSGELSSREPHLRKGLAGGLFVPDDSVLYPPAAVRHLIGRARQAGAEIHEGARVEAIGARSVTILDRTGERRTLTAASIVNAAGIDASTLTPGLPIVPRKGHLVITDRHPGICTSQLVELGYLRSAHAMDGASTAFNVQPRATGQILIGSSRELVGRDPTINGVLLRAMVQRAIEFLPGLSGCTALRAWTGFRPATPDNLPLIGRWEPVDGLWIAAGHEGLGITMALGTAELIAAGILRRTPMLDPASFDPMRAMPSLAVASH